MGLVTGISVTAFLVGKELYKYYTRYTLQKKQLDRFLKMYDKTKNIKTSETAHLRAG